MTIYNNIEIMVFIIYFNFNALAIASICLFYGSLISRGKHKKR